jgi:hypothetical protein
MASCSHPDCCNGLIIKDNGMRFKCSCGGRGDDEIARLRTELDAQAQQYNAALDRENARSEQLTSELAAVRTELAERTRERDEARANFLACAEAIGIVYEGDGCATAPGPVETVVEHIALAAREASDCLVEHRLDGECPCCWGTGGHGNGDACGACDGSGKRTSHERIRAGMAVVSFFYLAQMRQMEERVGERLSEARRERDARPAITPEMARDVIEDWDETLAESGARDGTKSFPEWDVVMRALREHAGKARP